jgi:alcohol dehydrogenase class IV
MNIGLVPAVADATAERRFEIDWWPNRIVFESGAVDRLGSILEQVGRRRAFVVCGRSLAAGDVLHRVKAALGGACAGVFTEIEMHAPLPVLERGVEAAGSADADCIVSLGGGSAIDSGKGIALIDTVGLDYRSFALSPNGKRIPQLRMAHIAIPTTTGSGSEVAPTCGLRDPQSARKVVFRDTRLIPSVAILDPQVTLDTPARLTAASGITAVARCVESLYSGRRNPIHSGIALHALRMLIAALPRSIEAPRDIAARSQCLIAAAMSAISANANVSAVHAIGHIVGGRYGLQHGIAHAILLAPTMRLMLPSIGSVQIPLLEALACSSTGMNDDEAGQRAADIVASFVAELLLPARLRDAGVPQADISALAEHAAHDPIMLASGAPIETDKIAALLRSAW